MFTVKQDGQGRYIISIRKGNSTKVAALQYVVYAMEHYFGESIPGYSDGPFDRAKHNHHNEQCGCCPLCKKAAPAKAVPTIGSGDKVPPGDATIAPYTPTPPAH